MQTHQWMQLALQAVWTAFIFAYGACLGSLINVVVYRMPLGLSIVTPPSRCPSCNTRLGWRDNIPVLGWLVLRGRCRYCRAKISPEYPIVEASVGLLFVLFYILWYVVPNNAVFLGVHWGSIRPEWFAYNDAGQTWPTFVLLLILLGSLVAMTIVDAKTFTIPLVLTWVPAIAAVLIHPLHALWLEYRALFMPRPTPGYLWAIPTPGLVQWGAIGAALGAVLGLLISNALLWLGLIRPSFADYAEWESEFSASQRDTSAPQKEDKIEENGAIELAAAPDVVIPPSSPPAAETGGGGGGAAELWIQYPHARREMFKELAFLGPAAVLGLGGWYFARWAAGVRFDPWLGAETASLQAPLWLSVLAGVLIGYLVGGGIVWAVRILGSLGFGKEAMGLGDVHLMAAVGACLGWIDATLAFFGAAFVGIAFALGGRLFSGMMQRAMPYGPFLAIATVLVLLTKPLIERGLSLMLQMPVNIP
jgi:leader peptidase (prepilin peptidase) / N-methyltransferase